MSEQVRKSLTGLLLSLISLALVINSLSIEQSLLVAVITFMVIMWTNEGLPMAVVSLLPIVLFPACGILTTKAAAVNYAHPIIFLFLGGFLIAIAVEKSQLHRWIAVKTLSLFPHTIRGIVFALAITSGLLSSVLSNTTTTLLLLPVALFLSDKARLKLRFVLAVAYGASVGGIITPIGTPPNLIFMGMADKFGMEPIAFVSWMLKTLPLAAVMFICVGYLLSWGVAKEEVAIEHKAAALNGDQKKVLGALMAMMLLLLVNAPVQPYYGGLGLSEPGILLATGLLLFLPPFSILRWQEDKGKIPFEITFLFGAGFAIAAAFTQTGLAKDISQSLSVLSSMPTLIFLLIVAVMVTFTTEVTSNTALISIMLPILYEVVHSAGLDVRLFMMVATVCASYAFMLPIATPPNAIAMSSGAVSVKEMMRYGIVLNLMGVVSIVTISLALW